MTKLKITIIILTAIIVSGCASSPNEKMRNNAAKTLGEYGGAIRSCNAKNNLLASNQFVFDNIVSNDMNRYELNSSNKQLTDETKVMLINYYDGIKNCRKEVRSKFLDMPYQYREIVINHEDANDVLYTNLLSDKITISEFNRNRKKNQDNSNAAIWQAQKNFNTLVQNDRQATATKNTPSNTSNAIAIGAVCAFTNNPALCASSAINSTSDTNNDRLNEIERRIQRQKYDRIIEDGKLREIESKLNQQEDKKRIDDIINYKTKRLN